jgi:hypothetical protein
VAERALTSTDPFALAVLAAFKQPGVAEAVAGLLLPYLPPAEPDQWLDTKGAAKHLGTTTNAIHKDSSAGRIPCHQRSRGGKLWFLRSELDEHRRNGGCARFHAASTAPKNRR